MELDSPPCCRLGACVCVVWEVYLCMDRATWRVPVEGDAELTVRGDETVTPMNNASVPVPPPLFSGRPIARRVPRPSQPSFPHGKYLTLTVAHVCHITLRFRRRKKKKTKTKKHCMYDEWWSYVIGARWKDILFFCGALTVWNTHTFAHTYCQHFFWHLHYPRYRHTLTTPPLPPPPSPHPKPGMCKHGPHLASTTCLVWKTKIGVYVYILCS